MAEAPIEVFGAGVYPLQLVVPLVGLTAAVVLHVSFRRTRFGKALLAVAINRICFYLGLGSERSNEVELCVVEAVTNVIRHAYCAEQGHSVAVAVTAETDRLSFEIAVVSS